MSRTSRNKGARGELEFARLVRSFGFTCERTGRDGRTSQDITHNVESVHFEIKRDERMSVDAMVRQSEHDADPDEVPAVAWRRNRRPWRVDVPATEYLRLKALERDLNEARDFLREAA